MKIQCERIQELLTSYALGDLSAAKAAEVKTHLEMCGDCQAALRQIGPTLDVLRDALAAPSSAPARLSDERRRRVFATAPAAAPAPVRAMKDGGRGIVRWATQTHPNLRRIAAIVLVSVIVLAFLTTGVFVNFSGKGEKASINATRASEAALRTAVDMYEVDTGRLPASLADLTKSDGSPNWHGPYVRGDVPVDAWGKPFDYKVKENGYELKPRTTGGTHWFERETLKGRTARLESTVAGLADSSDGRRAGALDEIKPLLDVIPEELPPPLAWATVPQSSPLQEATGLSFAGGRSSRDAGNLERGDEVNGHEDEKASMGEVSPSAAKVVGGNDLKYGTLAELSDVQVGNGKKGDEGRAKDLFGYSYDSRRDADFTLSSPPASGPAPVAAPPATPRPTGQLEVNGRVAGGEPAKETLVPLKIQVPKPMFVGTPVPIKVPNLEQAATAEPAPDTPVQPATSDKLKYSLGSEVRGGGSAGPSLSALGDASGARPDKDEDGMADGWEIRKAGGLGLPAGQAGAKSGTDNRESYAARLRERSQPEGEDGKKQSESHTINLNGANTFDGATTINAGGLVLKSKPASDESGGRSSRDAGSSAKGPEDKKAIAKSEAENRDVLRFTGRVHGTADDAEKEESIKDGSDGAPMLRLDETLTGKRGEGERFLLKDAAPNGVKSANVVGFGTVNVETPASGTFSFQSIKHEKSGDLAERAASPELRPPGGAKDAGDRTWGFDDKLVAEGVLAGKKDRNEAGAAAASAQPAEPFAPQPAAFDSVSIVKSPAVVRGIYSSRSPGARGSALGRDGSAGGGGDGTESASVEESRKAWNPRKLAAETPESAKRRETLNSLDRSIIPELDFRQANIHDAIAFCNETLAEEAKAKGEKAPKIELNLGDEKAVGGVGEQGLPPVAEQAQITFKARDISGLEALKIISNVANLKYRVDGDRILVVPYNAPCGPMLHRMYEVPRSVAQRIREISSDLGVSVVSTNSVSVSSNEAGAKQTPDWTEFFKETGVSWPDGSSIKYIPSLGKVMVANTADNLEIFEEQLAALSDGTPKETEPEEPPPAPPTEAPTGPRFKATGVNPMVTTVNQPFSTFSIDVDTASYTLSRNYMLKGQLPPAEAVRTEEFVNFFDYDYKPPANKTFGVYIDCAPSKFGHGQQLLKIGVKGRRLGREEQRGAVLTILVDTSGSMNTPDRIELAKKSLRMLIERLAPKDTVSLVQYDNHARVVLPPTQAANRKAILAAINELQCNGSTNLEEGMQRAYEVAGANFAPGAENRVLLLSDGAANLGAGSAEDILSKVESYRKQGIFCSVFGMGQGTYNDEMLSTLADKGDGVYRFIDSEQEARQVFVDDLSATLNTIARDVKIQVEFNPANVKTYRQLGYEKRQLKTEDFRNDAVDAGEVGSGQSVTALYELELAPQARAATDIMCTVRVRYMRTDVKKIEEIEERFHLSQVGRSFDGMDEHFRLAACAAEAAEILRGSPYAAGSEWNDVASALRPIALEKKLDSRVAELLRLVQGAKDMARGE